MSLASAAWSYDGFGKNMDRNKDRDIDAMLTTRIDRIKKRIERKESRINRQLDLMNKILTCVEDHQACRAAGGTDQACMDAERDCKRDIKDNRRFPPKSPMGSS